jgi:DNA sulfur modification protein DndE
MFKTLGIEIGKPWNRSQLSPELVDILKETALKIGSFLKSLPIGTNYHGAFLPPPSIGNFGADYITRAVVGRMGLTANTPSEAIYWIYSLDENGKRLTGANKYALTFKEELPFYEPGFWSITMYDYENNYTVSNPLNRYMLGSDTPNLKKNSDGSFTIYIQNESPGKDKEANWLPAPMGRFYLIPRAYAPKPELIRILKDLEAWPVPTLMTLTQ